MRFRKPISSQGSLPASCLWVRCKPSPAAPAPCPPAFCFVLCRDCYSSPSETFSKPPIKCFLLWVSLATVSLHNRKVPFLGTTKLTVPPTGSLHVHHNLSPFMSFRLRCHIYQLMASSACKQIIVFITVVGIHIYSPNSPYLLPFANDDVLTSDPPHIPGKHLS